MKIGRNEPCLCGSGNKYKRCCLAADEERARQERALEAQPAHAPGHTPVCDCCGEQVFGVGYVDDAVADELDEQAHQVQELIGAGRLDEAEALGKDLLHRFPDQIDGLERLADVYEARGDVLQALDYYRKTLTFATLTPGFDREAVRFYAGEVKRVERRLRR